MQLDLFTAPPEREPALVRADGIATIEVAVLADEPSGASTADPLKPVNLAEALAWYGTSDHPYRAGICSAFRQIAKVLGAPLDAIPSSPGELRRLLESANPAIVGIKPGNWKQIKSRANRGLRDMGVDVRPARDKTPLASEWSELSKRLTRSQQIGLSRLLRHFTRRSLAPADVCEQSFDEFRLELFEHSLVKDAESAYRQAVRCWNEAAAAVPGWPATRASQPGDPRRFSLPWSDFPASFSAEVEAFLTAKSSSNPLDDDDGARPTRPQTTKGRRKTLRAMASALVLSGRIPKTEVTSLAVLTDPENVKAALGYLSDRAGGAFSETHINYTGLMRTIAKYWLKDELRTAALKRLIEKLTKHVRPDGEKGMTPKNRERLRPFHLPSNVDLLIGLPERIKASVGRNPNPTYEDAVKVMRALQVGILTFVPIRSGNLTQLELGVHLLDVGKGSKRTVRIYLPRAITKTYRDYTAPLPAHLFPLLDAYLAKYRPLICARPSTFLFPNPSGGMRSRDALAAKLSQFVEKQTGLKVNAHLFRHIAAKLYLDFDPAGIEIVRQFLGHTSVKTTLRVYAELQTDPAFNRLGNALLNVGYGHPDGRAPRRKGGRRS